MFQSPAVATRTRPASRPAPGQSPQSPVFQLAGRRVTQTMFYAAHEAKRQGQRCFLVDAEPTLAESARPGVRDCPNCNGFGKLGLEIVVGGPFEDVPASGERGEGAAKVYLSAVSHNGRWFQVVRSYCDCPVCSLTREIVL